MYYHIKTVVNIHIIITEYSKYFNVITMNFVNTFSMIKYKSIQSPYYNVKYIFIYWKYLVNSEHLEGYSESIFVKLL